MHNFSSANLQDRPCPVMAAYVHGVGTASLRPSNQQLKAHVRRKLSYLAVPRSATQAADELLLSFFHCCNQQRFAPT